MFGFLQKKCPVQSVPDAGCQKRYAEQPVKSNPATCAADLRYFSEGKSHFPEEKYLPCTICGRSFPKKTQANCGRGGSGGGACSPVHTGCRLFRQPVSGTERTGHKDKRGNLSLYRQFCDGWTIARPVAASNPSSTSSDRAPSTRLVRGSAVAIITPTPTTSA